MTTFNKGDLFSKATAKDSFAMSAKGDAKSQYVKSVTGDDLGSNDFLKVKELPKTKSGEVAVNDKDFTMPKEAKEPPSRDTIGNIVLPPGSNPPPVPDPTDKSDKDMGELWAEHEKKRREFIDSGHTKEEADASGLKSYTFDEFKQNYRKLHPKSPEQM